MSVLLGPERNIATDLQSKSIALIDIDGTIYNGLIMEALLMDQMKKGLVFPGAVQTILDLIQDYQNGQQGQSTNLIALNTEWAGGCRGINSMTLLNHAREYVREDRKNFHPYTESIFNLFRQRLYETYLLSGEPIHVVQAVAELFGATGFCGTEWELNEQGVITGGIKNPMTSKLKGEWAEIFLHPAFKCNKQNSIALVDSVGDIGLVNAVPFSVVCGRPSQTFSDYLKSCGKPYEIVSSEQPEYIIDLIDRLTKQAI